MNILRDRNAYARYLGVRLGDDCVLYVDPSVCFGTEPWLISIGNHVEITANVKFVSHEGGMWCVRKIKSEYRNHDILKPISIGNNVMIGMNSLIMPGVKIGNNVIVGGHSVVTKDIDNGMIVAGVPAKTISTIDAFINKLASEETFETKHMSSTEKLKYIKKIHPEWF